MHEGTDFDALIVSARSGDQQAAAEIFRRFTRRLVGLARTRLGARLQSQHDPDDVVQSVYKSFFVRLKEGQFDLDGWDGLWGLLARITLRKCSRRAERATAAKRDVRRVVVPQPAEGNSSIDWQPAAREPSPEEEVMLAEIVERLLRELPQPEHREIVRLRLSGHDQREIAQLVGVTDRTVRRVLDRVREYLEGSAAGR